MVSLGPKGVLKYIEEDNSEYCDKLKDVFFGISIDSWLFCVLIIDSESSERGDSEYIRIF